MEVLHVCPSRSYSGLEQYAFEMASYQSRRGWDVGFVVCPESPLQKKCSDANISTLDFLYDSWPGRFRYWKKMVEVIGKKSHLKAIHLHLTDEVTHISVPVFWQRLRLGWKNHPKIIFQSHIWINHRKKDFLHKLLYSNIDEVWCSSKAAQTALSRCLPSNMKTIKIFNYGRNVNTIKNEFLSREEARKFLNLSQDRKIIGTVSRIEKAKGLKELVEASIPLLTADPSLDVVIIGGPSPNNIEADLYFQKILKSLDPIHLKVRDRILFKGSIPHSHRILKAFDLYVLPSYLECFSLSLLDAQLAGLPALGSNAGGTPSVVMPGETGWLFEPENVSSLSNALKDALSHPETWRSYGVKAQSIVENDFNQKNIFEQILGAYRDRAN